MIQSKMKFLIIPGIVLLLQLSNATSPTECKAKFDKCLDELDEMGGASDSGPLCNGIIYGRYGCEPVPIKPKENAVEAARKAAFGFSAPKVTLSSWNGLNKTVGRKEGEPDPFRRPKNLKPMTHESFVVSRRGSMSHDPLTKRTMTHDRLVNRERQFERELELTHEKMFGRRRKIRDISNQRYKPHNQMYKFLPKHENPMIHEYHPGHKSLFQNNYRKSFEVMPRYNFANPEATSFHGINNGQFNRPLNKFPKVKDETVLSFTTMLFNEVIPARPNAIPSRMSNFQ